jgi:23S rRNA (cytidine1920-2'-O)/16S rRNA (cytidine1409-2'-O)-methyltransferase
VVRDPEIWQEVLVGVTSALSELGAAIMGVVPSPITGAAGNVEFFIHARRRIGDPAVAADPIASALAEARSIAG